MTNKNVKSILKKLKKDELIEILTEICADNKNIKEKLLLKYDCSAKDSTKKLERILDKIINKYGGYEGYIPYEKIENFIDEMGSVLNTLGEHKSAKVNVMNAILFYKKLIEVYTYMDDVESEVHELIELSIEEVGIAMLSNKDFEFKIKEEILKEIIKWIFNELFDYSEGSVEEFWQKVIEFAKDKKMKESLKEELKLQIVDLKSDEIDKKELLKKYLMMV